MAHKGPADISHLREFLLTPVILAPGARGGGSEQHFLTPFPVDPVASMGSGGKFREAIFCAQALYLRAIGLRWGLLQTPKSPFQLKMVPRGITPRIVQVDILAKVLSSQELPEKSSSEKRCGAMQHIFVAQNFDARLAGIVI